MTLEELYEAVAADFKLDMADLGAESVRTTASLFPKYLRLYSEARSRWKALNIRRRKLTIDRRNFYTGNGTPEEYKEKRFNLKLRGEATIEKYVESDPLVVEMDEKIAVAEEYMKVLEYAMDEIKRRGFTIKSAIDYQKFTSGF